MAGICYSEEHLKKWWSRIYKYKLKLVADLIENMGHKPKFQILNAL